MSRSRGEVTGGYVRRTISLPKKLDVALGEYLQGHDGSTLSAVMTLAGEDFLRSQKTASKRER